VSFAGAHTDADSMRAQARLRQAAELAGFGDVSFQMEPIAAALDERLEARVVKDARLHLDRGPARAQAALSGELRHPGIRRLLLTSFIAILAFAALEATFSLFAKDVFQLDQTHVGFVFAYIGVVAVVMQGGLIGPLTRRFGESRLLVVGLALQAVTFVMLPYVGTLGGLLAVLAPMSIGSGLTQPSIASLLSRMAKKEDQGGTLGIGESASAMGRIIGPEAGTFTYSHISFAFPYVAGGVLMAVAAAVAATLLKAPVDQPGPGAPARS
jgi:predicted MFS family arabinose efflux permease